VTGPRSEQANETMQNVGATSTAVAWPAVEERRTEDRPMGSRKRSLLLAARVSGATGSSPGLAQEAPARLADTIEQRLAACAICHGNKGEGKGAAEYYPRLSGKPARYLFLQLVNFREGKRKYPQMVRDS
jgi:mono/diheme cytochrome c family protein